MFRQFRNVIELVSRTPSGAAFELPRASVSKRGFRIQNLSYENKFDLRENEPPVETHFQINGFPRRIALTQRETTNSEMACYITQELRNRTVVFFTLWLCVICFLVVSLCKNDKFRH